MKILSLHAGKIGEIEFKGKMYPTAIAKKKIVGPAKLTKMGIEGDEIGNPSVHGGEGRALYIMGFDTYQLWKGVVDSEKLKQYGLFGENVTLEYLNENEIDVGDQFSIGECIVEATNPRFPCFIMAGHLGYEDAREFLNNSKKSGVLFRVIKEGILEVGMEMKLLKKSSYRLKMDEFLEMARVENLTREHMDYIRSIPVVPKITVDRMEYRLIHKR